MPTIRDVHGNPWDYDGPNGEAKHSLKIDPAWKDPTTGYIAVAVGFREMIRESRHIVTLDGSVSAGEDLQIGWWFPTVAEGKPALPITANPAYHKAVLWSMQTGIGGIAIDGQTGPDGPPYRMWVNGTLNGKRITSETVHIGAVDDHVTLGVVWELRWVGAAPVIPPSTGGDAKSHLAAAISAISQQTLIARDALLRLT